MITIDHPGVRRHSVVLCHPDPTSFNAAVAARYVRTVQAMGQEAVLRDLYRMNFDPVLKSDERPTAKDFAISADVAEELEILAETDTLVLVYPIWFGLPPAMLKGYLDRVLGAGFPYSFIRDRAPHPLLGGKNLLSFSSSGTSKQWLDEQGAWLALRMIFDRYIEQGFSLESSEHIHFPSIVADLDAAAAEKHLRSVEMAAKRMCAIRRPGATAA